MFGPQTVGTATGAALIGLVDYRVLMVVMGVPVAVCAIPLVGFGASGQVGEEVCDLAPP